MTSRLTKRFNYFVMQVYPYRDDYQIGLQLRSKSFPYDCVYSVATVLAIIFHANLFIYDLVFSNSYYGIYSDWAMIILLWCVYGVVMHIMGVISTCLNKAETLCLIALTRVLYWIHFITSILITIFTFVLYRLATEEGIKLFLHIVFMILCLGTVLNTISWLMYVFYYFPALLITSSFDFQRYQQVAYHLP